MTRNLDVSLIRTFVAVAEQGSMTAAANLLHLTQGAVSQQIRRLEDLLGCALMVREARRLTLSRHGEQFLGKARQLLRLNDEIWSDMTAAPLQGGLRVGVPHDLVGTHLAPVMRTFADAYPRVEISLVCGTSPQLTDALARGTLDLALVEEPAGPATPDALRIEPLVWVGARGSDAHLKRPLPLSMVDESCAFRPFVLDALAAHDIAWRTVFESGNLEATAATVRSGLAVTAWLASTVPADLDMLTAATGLPPLPPFAISLRLPGAVQPVAREFARHAREALLNGGSSSVTHQHPGVRRSRKMG
jgi:DNA-binding transcriptional LysR family regulator